MSLFNSDIYQHYFGDYVQKTDTLNIRSVSKFHDRMLLHMWQVMHCWLAQNKAIYLSTQWEHRSQGLTLDLKSHLNDPTSHFPKNQLTRYALILNQTN